MSSGISAYRVALAHRNAIFENPHRFIAGSASKGGRSVGSSGYGSDKIDWLKAMGCFTEIINYRTKVFIPVDTAIEIIDNLITG
jgi:hypothetical protein